MKFYISYFYQLRNFPQNIIPFSTAIWDPKWFHDGKKQDYIFKDKKGIWNGLRAEMLHPEPTNSECMDCQSEKNPQICSFIANYREQLFSLDFAGTKAYIEMIAENIANSNNISNPEIVLLVYETPENKCSERWPLKEWFLENGEELEEWKKE